MDHNPRQSPAQGPANAAAEALSSQLQFSRSNDVSMLVGHRRRGTQRKEQAQLTSLRATSACDSVAGTAGTRRMKLQPAFASITMASPQAAAGPAAAKVPLFMIASASESKAPAVNAPAWRVAVGNLAAGAVSGCAVEAALYPIDTIKTRLQAMIGGGGIKALLEAGGGKGLYAGVLQNLAGVAPASAIFISVYEPVKQWVDSRVPAERSYLGPMAAGVAAGTASSLIRVPTEVIKSRLQTKEFTRALDAIRTILSREGFKGLYAGYGAFMLRDLPFDAIEFVAYEQLKRAYCSWAKRDIEARESAAIGAFAGGFTGIVTTPLDVLKTRLMTQGASGRYSNLVDALLTIARTEGPGALMRGWQPRLIWISMGGFVFFPVLEATKKYFGPKAPELEVTPLVDPPAPSKKNK